MDNTDKKSSSGRQLRDTLLALEDVIKSQQTADQQHDPTPTEFFAVIATTLSVGAGDERLPELLKVLNAVIPKASLSVVRSQFKPLSQSLLNIAKVHHEDITMLNLALTTLGIFLQYQDYSDGFWGSVLSLQCVNALIAFIDDERNKIRKTVHDQLNALMNVHLKHKATAVRSYMYEFCVQVIRGCTRNAYKRSLFIVMFLEYALVTIPESNVVSLIETCLKLQVCQIPKLTAAVYRMIDAFYQNPLFSFSPEVAAKTVRVLLANKPDTADMESNTYYCTALASGIIALHRRSRGLSYTFLVKVLSSLVGVCDSEFTQVHCAVGTALKRMITVFIDKQFIVSATADSVTVVSFNDCAVDEKALLGKVLSTIETLFQLKFQHAWLYVLDSVRSLFDAFKGEPKAASLLSSTVHVIAKLYQAIETQVVQVPPTIHMALADALGCILRAIGVVPFLQLVPLVVSTNSSSASSTNMGLDASREWIISILHSNLKLMPCSLSDFAIAVLPVASACSKASKSSELNAIQAKVTRNRVLQLWSLLPEMCVYHCKDIAASFGKMAPILTNIFQDVDYPDLVPHIVNALGHLARGVRERCPAPAVAKTPEYSALEAHSDAFIGILLEYIQDLDLGDGKFQEGLHCLSAWVRIGSKNIALRVAKQQLTVILTPSSGRGDDDNHAAVSMAIIMNLIPQLPKKITDVLYEAISPMLDSDNVSLQKRAYCILNELLVSHSEIVYAHKTALALVHQVHNSLLTCHVSSRNMRFRCLVSLLSSMTDASELKEASDLLLGEVLICQKDANKKSRDSALDILRIFISKLSAMDILMQLCSALVGETTVMRSSAVTCMCMLILENRDDEALLTVCVQLLPTVCLLLQEESADQTKAVLSYIRVLCATLNKDTLEAELPQLVSAFTSGLGNQKAKFTSRCRAIMRKLHHRVGEEVLRELIPIADLPLLDYIGKQNRRALRRKEKSQRSGGSLDRMLGSDSDDSSGDEDEDEGDEEAGDAMDVQDYRLASRPKAVRAKDTLKLSSRIPSSLEDLLEDQPAYSFTGQSTSAVSIPRGMSARAASGLVKKVGGLKLEGANVVPDDEDEDFSVAVTTDGKVVVKERVVAPISTAGGKRKSGDDETGNDDAAMTTNSSEQQPQPAESAPNKKRKLNLKAPGEEYKSKKSGGDVWKKGMLAPHAYIPLDARLFSKKNHSEAVEHFGVVVKNGKKTHQEKEDNFRGRHKYPKKGGRR